MPEVLANPLGLVLPLRIVQLEEAVKVMDTSDRVAAYIYVAAGRDRQIQTKRLSPGEGVKAAKVIARALTDVRSWHRWQINQSLGDVRTMREHELAIAWLDLLIATKKQHASEDELERQRARAANSQTGTPQT